MERIKELYVSNAKLIEQLSTELQRIKEKYGTNSNFYKAKKDQFQHMVSFHDETIEFISTLEKAYTGAKFLNNINSAIMHSKESDVPLNDVLKGLNLPSSKEILSM